MELNLYFFKFAGRYCLWDLGDWRGICGLKICREFYGRNQMWVNVSVLIQNVTKVALSPHTKEVLGLIPMRHGLCGA